MALAVPRHVLPLQGALGGDSFHQASEHDSELVIDLSNVRFASPAGIVALATLVDARSQGDHPVVGLMSPYDPQVANYLARTHVPAMLEEYGIAHGLPRVNERELGIRLVPLTTFAGSHEIQALARAAHGFAERIRVGAGAPLFTAICEIGENVGYHAGRPIGFAAAQYFPTLRAFEFAIGDAGRGFLGALGSQGASTHAEALQLALKPGVTSSREIGRGYGLSTVIAELLALGGTVTLYSGDHALIRYSESPEFNSESPEFSRTLRGHLQGVVVTARFMV